MEGPSGKFLMTSHSIHPESMMSNFQDQQYRAPPLPRPQYAIQPEEQQRLQQQASSSSSSSNINPYWQDQRQHIQQQQPPFPQNSTPTSFQSNEEEHQDSKSPIKGGKRAGPAPGSAAATGKRKERIHYSCTECHRRKQKCDRNTPCQHCTARNVPELCKTFRPGDDTTDVAARMKRLESLMDDGFRNIIDRLDSVTSQVAFQSQVQAQHFHTQQQQRQIQMQGSGAGAGAGAGGHASTRGRPNAVDEAGNDSDSENGGEAVPFNQVEAKAVESRIGPLLEAIPKATSFYDPPPRPDVPGSLDDAMKEFGSNGSSSILLADLPSKETVQALLDHFFKEINWVRQPLPEQSLRQSFEFLMKADPVLVPQNINLYGIMMALLSIASMSAPDSIFPDGPRSRRFQARKWHTATRRALFISAVLGVDSIEHVICLNLATRFLVLDKRISESWTLAATAVKASHAIGLHREPKHLGLGEKESELRRRVWSSVYFGDRILCMSMSRPTSVDDDVCDTLPPNDDVFDFDNAAASIPQHILAKFPSGVKPPTLMTHTSQRHHIAVLMGKIISSFQNVHKRVHYSEILQLDQEILAFRANLPAHFRSPLTAAGDAVEEPDKEIDEAFPFLYVHRYLIENEVNFLRTTLHRPYLLRSSGPHGTRYLPSRTACIEAAHHDIVLRGSFIEVLKSKFAPNPISRAFQVQIGSSKWFSSLLICGIALVLDPFSPKAPTLRNHLQHYFTTVGFKLQKLREAGEYVKDEMRERETSILELFLKKSDELRSQTPPSEPPSTSHLAQATHGNGTGNKRDSQTEGGRSIKRSRPTKSGSMSSGPEDEGEHATASLLLGLGQQGASSPLAQASHHRYSTSTSSNGSMASPLVPRSGAAATPGESPLGGGSGEKSADHAQQLFDAWYRAEFASGGLVDFETGVDGNGGNGLSARQGQSSFNSFSSPNPPFFGGPSNPVAHYNLSFPSVYGTDYSGQPVAADQSMMNSFAPFENISLQALQQQQQQSTAPQFSPLMNQESNQADDDGDFWKTLIEKITT